MKETRILAGLLVFLLILAVLPAAGLAGAMGHWERDDIGWRYVRIDGSVPRGGWLEVDDTWYHADGDGYVQTGWLFLDGSWYYFRETGAMATGWNNIGGSWYYMDEDGVMQTGWLDLDGARYYLDEDGVMVTDWLEQDGVWYFFKPSGAMARGEDLYGYLFDNDGHWIEN